MELSSYPIGTITADTKFLGSNSDGETKNFYASDIQTYVSGATGNVVDTRANYNASVSNLGGFITFSVSDKELFLPGSTDTSFPIGGSLQVQLTVAGRVSITKASGCTLTGEQYIATINKVLTIKRLSSTVWTAY